jgi:Zn-dependent M28 family amino/carboxypeptidase
MIVAIGLGVMGLWRARRGKSLQRGVLLVTLPLIIAPSAAMAWFFAVGPLLRAPSPGALDNGGSVAVLLRLAERLAARSPDAATTVKLVFLAAEEERAQGSWHFAARLESTAPGAVVNLETLGTSQGLGYVPEEGFVLYRYRASEHLVRFLDGIALETRGQPLPPVLVPRAAVTDARSFLAREIPAITLIGHVDGALPRQLHSAHDNRSRLSLVALERSVEFLATLVSRVDEDPQILDTAHP